ncbi:hypothetical protein BDV96DRAFT_642556 [Lophiotrema nucula]|uniref:Uncharacterized protein n=1 Tax=Lophiotrema nucula TaxID=690887 RepID=A0A6A5ZL05_9PLEO|nr:hypothetical protein BDV96DRAFT_642556 [Lophiotrema nucula]
MWRLLEELFPERLREFELPIPVLPKASVSTTAQVAQASDALTSLINTILTKFYGDHIRYRAVDELLPSVICWEAKTTSGYKPIAAIQHKPRDSMKSMHMRGSGLHFDAEDMEKAHLEARAIQYALGLDFVCLFDYDNLLLITFDGPLGGDGGPPRFEAGLPHHFRTLLINWLGEAIKKTGVLMTEPLPGKTIEESNIAAFGFSKFILKEEIYGAMDYMAAQADTAKHGISSKDDEGTLREVPAQSLPTVLDVDTLNAGPVATVSEKYLIAFVTVALSKLYNAEVKQKRSKDPGSMIWYIEKPSGTSIVACMAYMPRALRGIMKESKQSGWVWDMMESCFTGSNESEGGNKGEDIFQNQELRALCNATGCHLHALFDYESLVLFHSDGQGREKVDMACIDPEDFRKAILGWLRRAYPLAGVAGGSAKEPKTIKRNTKVGRNEKCPCMSGKKFKVCCGKY